MKKAIIVMGLAVVAWAALAGYRWWSRPAAEVFAARRGTAISAVYGTVRVEPTVRRAIRVRTAGVIRLGRIPSGAEFAAGMDVKEGDLLGVIENPEMARELVKAEADLKAGEEKQRLGPPSAQLLKTAAATLDRLEKLAALNNAPASEVTRMRNETQALREKVQAEQVEIDHTVAVLREQVGGWRDRKTRCELQAPMDGVLAGVNVVSGDFVQENSAPFVISTKTFYLEGQINEEDVGALSKQLKAVVSLYSYPGREFTASLANILPAGENQRYVVRLEFETPPDNLLAGMTGEMNIILGKQENSLLVPTRALRTDRVWVVADGVIQPRKVKPGSRSLEWTAILDGLQEGEFVVLADQDLFRAGQRVRVMSANR
jgi:RND family efflux transporter MFP subunit